MSKSEEFGRHWPVVLAAFFGLAAWVLPFFILGPTLKALEAEFGWSRAAVMAGSSFLTAGAALATPLAGYVVDRIGARPVALFALTLSAFGVGCLSLLGPNIIVFYGLLFLTGLLGTGPGGVPFTRAVGGWFHEARGLAIGIALAGTGLAAFLSPHLGALAREGWQWRSVYILVAAVMALAIPVVFFLLREPGRDVMAGQQRSASNRLSRSAGMALSRRKIFIDIRFQVLAIVFAILGLAVPGLMLQVVPLLIDNGYDTSSTAKIASLMGLSVIVARLVIGWMLDRYPPVIVGFMMLMTTTLGCTAFVLWGAPAAGFMIVGLGITVGAELDLMAFMAMRFFGLASYGLTYGSLFAINISTGIISPIVMGLLFEHAGYVGAITGGAFAFGIAAVLFTTLGFVPRVEPAKPAIVDDRGA
jgi:MFS family permease